MDSYKKGGKMPSWLLEMFKKKAKKSMNLGGNLGTGKPVIRETDKEVIQFDRVDPNRQKGEKKNTQGMVVRHDSEGRPYHVKKGLLNETEYYQHRDGSFSPTVKNRTRLGKFLLGSDVKASFGDGGGCTTLLEGSSRPTRVSLRSTRTHHSSRILVEDDELRTDDGLFLTVKALGLRA